MAKTQSLSPGMGAIPGEDGVTFRVWAPHADAVAVIGTFNDWDEDGAPLRREEGGYWAALVPEARRGDEYRFVIVTGEERLIRLDPYARQVTSSVGNSVVYLPEFEWAVPDDYRTPPWHRLVIYELHPGTFAGADDDGPGDLRAAAAKLPYLRDLGVNAVQLMPPMEFAGGRSWGYNPASPFAIETDYGGPDALKTFVRAAHDHGLAVILDVVYNHFGPSDLDLWRFDGWYEGDGGGIYFYNDWRAATPWGHTRPDYGRPEVRQYIRDNALMWVEDYRIDGLRWDATAYIRNVHGQEDPGADLPDGWGLMRWVNDEIDARQPWKIAIAEDLRTDPAVTEPTEAGGAGFDSQWDAGFVHPVRHALIESDDARRDVGAVAAALHHRYGTDAFRRVVYTESHDEVANGKARVPEEIWPGNAGGWHARKRSTLGAVLVFTSPGVPMIFQGQEFLEDQWFRVDDPLDWSKAETYAGVVDLYRDLIALRLDAAGTTAGLSGQHIHVHHVNPDAKVLAFHRWSEGGPGDDVVVVANFSAQPFDHYVVGLPHPGTWHARFDSDSTRYGDDYSGEPPGPVAADAGARDGLDHGGGVRLGAYSAVILSQDR